MSLGMQVAENRRAADLTQSQLAERLGTTQSAISKIESGRVVPSLRFLDRLVKATGQSFVLTISSIESTPGESERRKRVGRILGDYVFDPWERDPTPVEARSLARDGLSKERFQRRRSTGGRGERK